MAGVSERDTMGQVPNAHPGGADLPPDPVSGGAARQQPARWWQEVLFVAVFYLVYEAIRGAISGSVTKAEHDALDLMGWERWTHLDPEHALNNAMQHLGLFALPACYFYAALYAVVTPAVLIWVYRARPGAYRETRTILATLTAAALIGFWAFPTAPPRLLTHAGFHDTMSALGRWGWWGGDGSVPGGAAATIANQFAAMPSLHVAWATWCAATVFRLTSGRAVRAIAVAYPVLTALIVLATANHYLADVLAGVALWIIADGGVRHARSMGVRGAVMFTTTRRR